MYSFVLLRCCCCCCCCLVVFAHVFEYILLQSDNDGSEGATGEEDSELTKHSGSGGSSKILMSWYKTKQFDTPPDIHVVECFDSSVDSEDEASEREVFRGAQQPDKAGAKISDQRWLAEDTMQHSATDGEVCKGFGCCVCL